MPLTEEHIKELAESINLEEFQRDIETLKSILHEFRAVSKRIINTLQLNRNVDDLSNAIYLFLADKVGASYEEIREWVDRTYTIPITPKQITDALQYLKAKKKINSSRKKGSRTHMYWRL